MAKKRTASNGIRPTRSRTPATRLRTFTDTLQPRERPAELSTSAPQQEQHGAGAQLSTTCSPPHAQGANAHLGRPAGAPLVRRRHSISQERAVQRATLHGKHLDAQRRAAPSPPTPSRAVPHLDTSQPARRRRRTGGACVSSARGPETLQEWGAAGEPTCRSRCGEARSGGAEARHAGARHAGTRSAGFCW